MEHCEKRSSSTAEKILTIFFSAMMCCLSWSFGSSIFCLKTTLLIKSRGVFDLSRSSTVGHGRMSDNGVGRGGYNGLSLGENGMSVWCVNSKMVCILTLLETAWGHLYLWGCYSLTAQNGAIWEVIFLFHTKDTPLWKRFLSNSAPTPLPELPYCLLTPSSTRNDTPL